MRIGGQQPNVGPEPIPPEPDGLMADLDTTLMQQVLDVPQRPRQTNVEHHRQADDLGACLEVAEGVGTRHARTRGGRPAPLKRSSSDRPHLGRGRPLRSDALPEFVKIVMPNSMESTVNLSTNCSKILSVKAHPTMLPKFPSQVLVKVT